MLYLKSELTENRWRIYSDNIAMARWLQTTVQGMLNPETADTSIPVTDAAFSNRATRITSGPSAWRRTTKRSRSPGTTSASRC